MNTGVLVVMDDRISVYKWGTIILYNMQPINMTTLALNHVNKTDQRR